MLCPQPTLSHIEFRGNAETGLRNSCTANCAGPARSFFQLLIQLEEAVSHSLDIIGGESQNPVERERSRV